MVTLAGADTPSMVQTMCTVQGRQGAWQGLSQDATVTGSKGQVHSAQKKVPKDESRNTAASDRHDLHLCRSEVCW